MLQVRKLEKLLLLILTFLDLHQVLSGKLPYHHIVKDSEVLITLHHGAHPPRPQELADEHWELITRCWAEDPRARPDIKNVFECVQHHYQAADSQIVPRIPNLAEAIPADDAVVIRNTQPSTLAFILAFIMGSLALYHSFN
jgi:hypothetical protein